MGLIYSPILQARKVNFMAFPNLILTPGGVLHSEKSGTPINGDNTFELGILPENINEEYLDIEVTPLGPSVTSASYVSLSPDKKNITINFTQAGANQAKVTAKQTHSLVR